MKRFRHAGIWGGLALTVLAFLCSVGSANGQVTTFSWNSTGAGNFDDPTKWSAGSVPQYDPNHYVYWQSQGVTTVHFNGNEGAGLTYVRYDGTDLTLDLDGNTYTTNLVTLQNSAALTILDGTVTLLGTNNVSGATSLTVGQDGSFNVAGHIIIGNSDSADSTFEIVNGGSVSHTGAFQIRISQHTSGTAQSRFSIRGRDPVTQAPSSLSTANAVGVGGSSTARGSPGTLELRDGGNAAIGLALVVWEEGTIDMGSDTSLSAGSLNTKNGSLLKFEIHHDQAAPWITLSGAATIETDSTMELALASGYQFTYGQEFELVQYGSLAGAGVFSGWTTGIHTVGGQDFELSYGSGSNDVILLTAIPEPGVMVLMTIGACGLVLRRRLSGCGRVSI